MKICDLYLLNQLNKKCEILVQHCFRDYDYYFLNDIEWLEKNSNKINEDFKKNIDKFTFEILLNCTNNEIDERSDIIISFQKKCTLEQFSEMINYIPFNMLEKNKQNEIVKLYNTFKNLKKDYEIEDFFEKNRRR